MLKVIVFWMIGASFLKGNKIDEKDEFIKKWVLGKYDPHKEDKLFSVVPAEYTIPSPGKEYTFHNEALEQFIEMRTAAAKDGVKLNMLSSLRNFDYQSRIWNSKFKQKIEN